MKNIVLTGFISNISIILNSEDYLVYSADFMNSKIIKQYNEQLTDAEIEKIVKSEMKRHTEFIEAKIKEIENKNL